MVDFQAIGEVADACSTFVRMCDYYDFVAAVDEFLEGCQDRMEVREKVGLPVHTDDNW